MLHVYSLWVHITCTFALARKDDIVSCLYTIQVVERFLAKLLLLGAAETGQELKPDESFHLFSWEKEQCMVFQPKYVGACMYTATVPSEPKLQK